MIKRLPKWMRQLIACWMEFRSPEWGGILYDFTAHNTGDLEELHRWETDKGLLEAAALIESAYESGRDYVYITVSKTGNSQGYFMVESPITRFWFRAFHPGVYEPLDAYRDTIKKAEKDARRLGFQIADSKQRGLVSE